MKSNKTIYKALSESFSENEKLERRIHKDAKERSKIRRLKFLSRRILRSDI